MHVYIKIGDITLLSKNRSKNCEKKGSKRSKFNKPIKLTKISTN
jgi:hypothetical protein